MPPVISNARAYFDHARNQPDPFRFLSAIPSPSHPDPFFEEEWIDFKGNPKDEKDARKIWSKALSGYANITDGLIVWGIDAREMPPRDIDAACGLRLIPDPVAFESKLRDWIRDATNPPVMGVEYASFPGPSTEGFVICLVPQSGHKPHRAEWADKHYYYRAGDDFLVAEPGLLRILFYPRASPRLRIEVNLRYELHPRDLADEYRDNPAFPARDHLINKGYSIIRLNARLHNDGTATAKDVYIVVQSDDQLRVAQDADWTQRTNSRGLVGLFANRPFHPGEVSEIFWVAYEGRFNNWHDDAAGWKIIPIFDRVALRFLLYAEGMEPQAASVEFTRTDLTYEEMGATKTCVLEES